MLTSRTVLKHAAFILGALSPLVPMIGTYFSRFTAEDIGHYQPWVVAILGFGLYAAPFLVLGVIISPCLRRPHHPAIRYLLGVATFYLAHIVLFTLKMS